ncbi:hypothetical protein [Paenibacillus protaetiae]|uniref:Uncharacterized protein n=1 Tax=Paenibacillus protaetiae TaxID=2509456 RepID=A0A4P6F0W2_9BACL|nr:hypothetical protein [Paenibacillus protaetiae]QAY66647.1 hypothetical protein ET464_09755 [Paenibacillus protaetiae]
METFIITAIEIQFAGQTRRLAFTSAELVIVTDYGSALWYLDVNHIEDTELLQWFADSENILVHVTAGSGSGAIFEGTGYFHPNVKHQGAAIRGEGELLSR